MPEAFVPRDWQERFARAYQTNLKKNFLLEACTSAGKTGGALNIFDSFKSAFGWRFLVVIVPAEHLKRQYAVDAQKLFGLQLYYSGTVKVLPGVLMERELALFLKEFSNNISLKNHNGRTGVFGHTETLNGVGVMASDWVRALEALTLRNDLRFLTMLTWADVFPAKGLLRKNWAYCPACFQEWHDIGQAIYEPLLWALKGVDICPYHHQPLLFQCLHCGQSLVPLAWRSRPGYCSKCGQWLGKNLNTEPLLKGSPIAERSRSVPDGISHRQLIYAKSIGELIAAQGSLSWTPSREKIKKAFSICIDKITQSNIAAFASLVGKPKNTVWTWQTGKALPQLNVLEQVCYCLEVSVLDFLMGESLVHKLDEARIVSPIQNSNTKICCHKNSNLNQLKQSLEAIKDGEEYPPPCMEDVARCSHTPDFFIIRQNTAGWEECKTEEELVLLAANKPYRNVRNQNGHWRCPPGEEYARKYGLYYAIRSSKELDPVRLRNFTWLEPYFCKQPPPVNQPIKEAIISLVKALPGITFSSLILKVQGATPDDINTLIATKQIYVNLSAAPLAEPDRVQIFLNQEIAIAKQQLLQTLHPTVTSAIQVIKVDVGSSLSWDGEPWQIINLGSKTINLQRSDRKVINLVNTAFNSLVEKREITCAENQIQSNNHEEFEEILRHARPEDIETANHRYQAIQPYLQPNPPQFPPRSIRRWRDNYWNAEKLYGNGYVGLLPKHHQKGSHEPKLDEAVREFMAQYIAQHYENLKNRRITGVYRAFIEACEAHEPKLECLIMLKAAQQGEEKLKHTQAELDQLRSAMGLLRKFPQMSTETTDSTSEQQPNTPFSRTQNKNVGKSKPRRYRVGGSSQC